MSTLEKHTEHDHEHASFAQRKIYILENLGCANCAAKMEAKIQALPNVEEATITFATKQLRLTAKDPDALIPKIQDICSSIESQVKVVPRESTSGQDTEIFILGNLCCANCAAKMEAKIAALPGIEEATLTFTTRQLRIKAKDPLSYLDQIRAICKNIEEEVTVHPRRHTIKPSTMHRPGKQVTHREEELAHETCGCGHEHQHEHETCGCGHEHQLEHETCGCGHEHQHEHETCGCGHEHSHEHHHEHSHDKNPLREIILGAILFLAGVILEKLGFRLLLTAPIQIIAYLILGRNIVRTAFRNLIKGQVFDENFLMSIATLGAFCIQNFEEAVGVMLFFRIGEYFEDRAVEKSRSQIMDAIDMRPEVVHCIIDGEIRLIPAEEVITGDRILVRPGDRIPLDGIVIEGESRIDTSPLTGEPVPVAAYPGKELLSGCVNTSGQLTLEVTHPLSESMVTRILDSVENAAASKPKLDRFITRFARVYTPIVVFLALATAIIPSLFTGDWHYWIYTALSFLVMSCPCALVLSIPLAFFSGIGAGSKKGILFKGGASLEFLSKVRTVIMDKTGTITEGNFVLDKIVPANNQAEELLLYIAAVCERNSTHPIAVSIITAANERGIIKQIPEELEEIPGHGIHAKLQNREFLCGNRKLMEMFGVDLSSYRPENFGAEVLIASGGKFMGHLVIADTLKKDAKSGIAKLKSMNISTVMLTGDAKENAEAAAKDTGIDEVYARLLPDEKLTKLQEVRAKNGSVMFVGDGINDAPVLAGADVGAAMGSGADAAIEAADVVFMTSSVEAIPQSIAIARATQSIAMQNVIFALVIKIAVMILGLCGHASMWAAVFADTGVAMLCILNSIRILYKK